MAHMPRGATMTRGRGAPMRGGRPPPQQIMPAPQGYYEPPPPHPGMPHHPGYRPRGRGGAPPLGHHHSHPGAYAPTEPPGGYPGDLDSSEDITPESGSPEGSELTHHQPGPPPGVHPGYGGFPGHPPPPQNRQYLDGMMAENAHLRQEVSSLRAQAAEYAAGGGAGWESGALATQLRDANAAIDIKDSEIFSLHAQMQEMMAANQAEIAKLKEDLKAAEGKLKEEADKRDNEVKLLQGDLDDVTAYLSIAKAEEGVVDDKWFKEELAKFATQLRNWVWKHCKAASQMPENVEDRGVQMRIQNAVPNFSQLTMTNSRMTVMQAVVQDIVLRRIFDRYCVGLTIEQELAMRGMEDMMNLHTAGGIPNYAMINRWRALSISLVTGTNPVKDMSESAIVDCCSEIESIVFSLIPGHKQRPGDAASRALIPLLANAVRISHHFKGQRARIDVVSPVGHIFDPEWMEDASGLEDDADEELRGKMVGACAFPAVIKWGNEKGEDYGLRTVIFRAKVLCLLDND
ncbi:hypothetical protein H072_1171 [Dactylellina haptotyla CBS 200.50]|uniref:Uncharacterized protein n=1 Tax=Dactylellina haptotyla (strain CBS 200.50) TaxID=1284197 RepID=S8BZJ3_DACHA|nr:hypothetical protein H072_1171 [Dactylellina haptotyla CBS 200.50]